MNRRDFLKSAGAVSASLTLAKVDNLFAEEKGQSNDGWRTFDVTTKVTVLKPSGTTLVWLPAALVMKSPFQRTLSNKYHAEGGGKAGIVEIKPDALGIVSAKFPAGQEPTLTLTTLVQTKDYSVDLSKPGVAPKANQAELE